MGLPAKGNNGGDCAGSVGSVLGVYVTDPSNEVLYERGARGRWGKIERGEIKDTDTVNSNSLWRKSRLGQELV